MGSNIPSQGSMMIRNLVVFTILAVAAATVAQDNQPASQTSAPAQPAQPAAQTPGQAQAPVATAVASSEPATVLKFTSRLVVVDVIATDHKGNPVTDLKREDFTVQEDGKDQQLKVFEFRAPGHDAEPAIAQSTPAGLAPNIFSNAPRFKPSTILNVLLLDALNTRTIDQKRAREQMLEFLEKLPQGQPVAVYGLGIKLRLLQDFTTDPNLLKEAVKGLKGKNSPVLNNPAGGPNISDVPAGMQDAMPAQMLQQVLEFQKEEAAMQTELRVRLTLDALDSIARSLAGYSGRKNLIWLSESFPMQILADENTNSARSASTPRDFSTESIKTATRLTDAQVAVYPVDIGELVGNSVFANLSNTDSTGNYMGRTLSARGANPRTGANTELGQTAGQQFDAHASMNDIADRTGGKAFYNRNDVVNSIGKAMDDGSSYYTLAYAPQNKDWNGNFRKIQVKVNRSGVKLRYRTGYFATDPRAYAKVSEDRRVADFRTALSVDFPVSTAVPFQARVRTPSPETKNKTVVNYAVDPKAINFETQPDGLRHAGVDCAVAIYTRRGEMVTVHGNTSNAKLTEEQFGNIIKAYFPCNVQFDLAPGDYVFRMGVRDTNTGLIGSTNAAVTVPPTTAANSN